ncbi:ras guanine nucleotide exchange factor domain-containing protein [Russula earlei]|uniref:Ras guanine nucleotide exchange factor domain-containing protein n=1 Tax=Russula earlei TaxID=71964 RepID=A0ACC0UCS2_9AGAM|nr:ras guanine nucleotide exchange factor domain-containing protein [Russula earlei]
MKSKGELSFPAITHTSFTSPRRTIERIHERVLGWARLSDAAAFLKQNVIHVGIEDCHRELTACTDKFTVALSIINKSQHHAQEQARQRDHQKLYDLMIELREEFMRNKSRVAPVPQPNEPLLQEQPMIFEERRGHGTVPVSVAAPSRSALDFSGKVLKASESVMFEGNFLVFYRGQWINDGHLRFKDRVEASIGIQHPNVLRVFGHVTIEGVVYSVHPWMENGNIREYLRKNPDADRTRLLSEVASGLEFLHERNIVHGDLCGKSILVNGSGKTFLCAFGLSEFSNRFSDLSRARWFAPERISSSSSTSLTSKVDIWSFGLLCLEVFTGNDPYSSIADVYVPILLNEGKTPEHPGPTAVGLSPDMWELMQSCWQINPTERPPMPTVLSLIRHLMDSPNESYQQPVRRSHSPTSILISPTNDIPPPMETSPKSIGSLSPTTSQRSPGPSEISPLTREPNSETLVPPLRRQNDLRVPIGIPRTVNDPPSSGSGRLSPLLEDHDDPFSLPPRRRAQTLPRSPSPDPSVSPDPPPPLSRPRQISVDSLSSQSTSGNSDSSTRPFWKPKKRSQTTLSTTPSIDGDPYPPSSLNHSPTQGTQPRQKRAMTINAPNADPLRPQPSRSASVSTILTQSRGWIPVNPVVTRLMETVASDPEGLVRPALDGTVSSGNLEGLVSRVIHGSADLAGDESFKTTFLTIYRLFSTSERLFNVLKRRFESTDLNPAHARSRYSILLFIQSWLKKGFDDEELRFSPTIKEFTKSIVGSQTMEAKAAEIASLVDEAASVRRRQPGTCTRLRREPAIRPQRVTPADFAVALTVVKGDRFKYIMYWDYVNFTRTGTSPRRIDVFNTVHDLVTRWVKKSVLLPDQLNERKSMYEEWINTAQACRNLNNFSSTSAIVTALMSSVITTLPLTSESKANSVLHTLAGELTPTNGAYQNTLEQVATKDLIPWLDPHLSYLNSSFDLSDMIVEVDSHPLIDFRQCSKLGKQIDSLAQFSPPRVRHITPPDVLAYVEYSLKSCTSDYNQRATEERSAKLAGEERQCLDLASALHDHSPGLEGTGAQQAVDEVERVLTRILGRVRKWEELGKMRSFVKQTEIRLGLEESYRELRTCSMRFNIALHLNANTRGRELEEIRKRDHDELVEIMTKALRDSNLLKMELATSTPEVALNFGLKEADVGEMQGRQLQEDLGELQSWVEGLPAMVDLSGKVSRTSDRAIATGGSQDIYTGEMTGTEVALAYPRNQSREAQERFRRQVEIWRTLRHPNVLQLLGIAYIGDFVYSVSPFMEFGHIKGYLKDHPEANRVMLLSEIASASEYLHINGIIHGDLQGSNVLISGHGHACLCDFGSARIEQVPVTKSTSYGSLRWLAPELVTDSSCVPTTRATDVWSFGMLSLEIFTDNVPFSHISNEAFVPLAIRDGPLPTRPEQNITLKGLSDAMWDLLNRCWQRDPGSRPSMPEIREVIQQIHPSRSSLRSATGRTLSSGTSPIYRHGNSFSSVTSVPTGTRPSALTLSRPPGSAGLSPPTNTLSVPKPLIPDEVEPQRGLPASFPARKSPILNIPLSSSPPSQQGLTSSPRSVPGKPLPSPARPSPLSSNFQVPLPSTTPESYLSAFPPPTTTDHNWSLRPPIYLPESTTSSVPELSLLLQPVHPASALTSQSEYEISRTGSTTTGSVRSSERNLSVGSPAGLLDAAVRDVERVLRRTADGTVEAGTLEGLVDRLIQNTRDHAKDNEFRRVFLATYHIFTTHEDLFRILKRRFEEVGIVRTSIHSASIPYSILLLLRTWLSGEGERIDHELLSSIKDFASSIGGSEKMRELTQEIVNLATEKMNIVVVSPPTSPPPQSSEMKSPCSPEQFKAVDIALSLSVIEGDYYSKITQADYIAHLRGKPITKHIQTATKLNNRLVNWVKTKILSSEDVNKRATNFKRFLLTAEECRKLQNFSSMSAIVAALQSVPQLILTRESKLAKGEKQFLGQMDEIVSPQGDHRAYREALRNLKTPNAIPWLAVHLRSLQNFYDRSSATVVVDQRPLINFSRCRRLLERIDDVQRFRVPSDVLQHYKDDAKDAKDTKDTKDHKLRHRQQHQPGWLSPSSSPSSSLSSPPALAWVMNELDNAPSAISREHFEARVSALAELERKMRDRRELELRSLGFQPVPRRRTSSGSPSLAAGPVSGGARTASLDTRLGRI